MKQVLVIRKDLNMRKGKMVAQGAHASLKVALKLDEETLEEWTNAGQTKICVSVDSEQELLDIFQKAANKRLPCSLIRDAGRTEFKEPTLTAAAIGPAEESLVDAITGHLKLL